MSFRKRKKVEYRPTEGDPRNTQASFPLQDFKMWKFSTFSEFAFYVLLLLALPPTVNSNETPTPRMCAVCLEKYCATGVRRIFPAGGNTAIWPKAKSPTGIQNCSMENLKADVPCKMANGSLVQPADNPVHFEGIDAYGVRRPFNSQILPCADLKLPPISTPSSVIKAPIHNVPTPAAPNNSVADNKAIAIAIAIASVIGIGILILIFIGVLIRKLCNCQKGGGDRRPDENATEMGLLNGQAANGNLNKVH